MTDSTIAEIETRLHSIVEDCIEQYPKALGGPVEVLRLTLSSRRTEVAVSNLWAGTIRLQSDS
jgi:hypothetical protein